MQTKVAVLRIESSISSCLIFILLAKMQLVARQITATKPTTKNYQSNSSNLSRSPYTAPKSSPSALNASYTSQELELVFCFAHPLMSSTGLENYFNSTVPTLNLVAWFALV
jgi:hypothetical protein